MIEPRVFRSYLLAFTVVVLCGALGFRPSYAQEAQGLLGGGGRTVSHNCLLESEQEEVRRLLSQQPQPVQLSPLAGVGDPPKFTFYPMAGTSYGDLFLNNYVDLDPSPNVLDFDCTDLTYNGHDASDMDLRGFGEQAIGVPVFAALDGVVISVREDQPDMNTSCTGIANHVVLQHPDGRQTNYWHLKQNGVDVSLSQEVRAGEQLGLAASSGCSSHPHLHFSVYDSNGVVEPFAGDCRPGDSGWENQSPVDRSLYIRDFGFTVEWMNWPFDTPRTGTFVAGSQQTVRTYLLTGNFPANSTHRFRFIRPDSSVGYDTGLGNFGNTDSFKWALWYFGWNINFPQLGTWHLEIELNGELMTSAPFTVVATAGEIVNRAPLPITVQIEPEAPTVSDVLICRVGTDLVVDDPDYEIVRYHYVWEVDGDVVRDVTTAAHSDAIPHHTAGAGSTVTCTVTPGDGAADGPSAQAMTTLAVGIPPILTWNPDPQSSSRGTRSLSISATAAATATGGTDSAAIRVLPIELQNPNPANPPCCPPPNFDDFESSSCSAVGEAMGCARWVGPPVTILESQTNPALGSFLAARLQCTPYYADWTSLGEISIFSAEVVPSSTYEITAFGSACKGLEQGCTSVGTPVFASTRRYGDVAAGYNPPSTAAQPDALDVVALVNKFRNLVSASSKRVAQLQPNVLDLNADVNALDIVAVVDAFRGLAYAYGGPCSCPSAVTCNATSCTSPAQCSGGLCIKTCGGGVHGGQPCTTDANCPGSACGAGSCRDRCGRCQ